jgi:hypothetical protein
VYCLLCVLIENLSQNQPLLLQTNPKLSKEIQELYTKQYDMEFKAEYDAFMKCKQFYEANTTKVYTLLWEQCGKKHEVKLKPAKKLKGSSRSY